MKNATFTHLLAIALGLFILISPAQAIVIYDETVSADLGNTNQTATDMGTLFGADNLIIGSLDAGTPEAPFGPDEHDVFIFTADSSWSLDFDALTGNSVVVFLFDSNQTFITATTAFGPSADVYSNMDAGTYYMNFTPSGNINTASYTASINVASVPETATLFLLGLGLIGFGLQRRKQSS